MNASANMGAWTEEPKFTPEIGQQALKSAGRHCDEYFTVSFSAEKMTELAKKHGTMPFGQYACDIAIAETFNLGIWSAGAFADYFDCEMHDKFKDGTFHISIWIGYPVGALSSFRQYLFDTKRLIWYWLGY